MSSISSSYSFKNSFRYYLLSDPNPILMRNNSHTPQLYNEINHRDEGIIMNEEQATLYHYPMSLRIVSFILSLLFGFVFIWFLP